MDTAVECRDINYKIGERIRFIREKHNIDRKHLSHLLGFSDSYISSVESGKKAITTARLEMICQYFGITLYDFYRFTATGDITSDDMLIEFQKYSSKEQQMGLLFMEQVRSQKLL